MKKLNPIQLEKMGIRRYSRKNQFNFDMLTAPPLFSMITPYDAQQIHDICLDPRLNNKLKQKEQWYKEILGPRGFEFLGRGTNRIVFKCLENQNIVLKVPLSEAGRTDNPSEFRNQHLIKPFCTKVFEVSQDGLIGVFERGELIRNDEVFYSVADQVFNFYQLFLGKYIMADVGSEFRKNWLIRPGFGAILGDFPLIYNLDGGKLFCNQKDLFTGIPCGGSIDYDTGYNRLYCKKCGKQYFASSLAKKVDAGSILKRKDMGTMEIIINKLGKDGEEIQEVKESIISSKSYLQDIRSKKQMQENKYVRKTNNAGEMQVSINFPLNQYEEQAAQTQQEEIQNLSVDHITVDMTPECNPTDNNEEPQDYYAKETAEIEAEQQALQKLYLSIEDKKKVYISMVNEYNKRLEAVQQRADNLQKQFEAEKETVSVSQIEQEKEEEALQQECEQYQDNDQEERELAAQQQAIYKEMYEQEGKDIEKATATIARANQTPEEYLDSKKEEMKSVAEIVKEETEVEEAEDETSKYLQEQRDRLAKKYGLNTSEVDKILCESGFDIDEAEAVIKQRFVAKQQSVPFPKQHNKEVDNINSNSQGKYPATKSKGKKKHLSGNAGY